jgi:fused signal recognition particle receptor
LRHKSTMFGFFKKSPEQPPAPTNPVVLEGAAPVIPWRQRLKAGLARTRAQFSGKLKSLFSRGKVDDELLEDLEGLLLSSDVGLDATQHLLYQLKMRAKRDRLDTPEAIQRALSEIFHELLQPLEEPLDLSTHHPFIIMIAGVNGAGKTTSIGKLAKHFQAQGRRSCWLRATPSAPPRASSCRPGANATMSRSSHSSPATRRR